MNWQPIETAPIDRALVLLYCMGWDKFGIEESCGTYTVFETPDGSMYYPSHWMPLPEPPNVQAK